MPTNTNLSPFAGYGQRVVIKDCRDSLFIDSLWDEGLPEGAKVIKSYMKDGKKRMVLEMGKGTKVWVFGPNITHVLGNSTSCHHDAFVCTGAGIPLTDQGPFFIGKDTESDQARKKARSDAARKRANDPYGLKRDISTFEARGRPQRFNLPGLVRTLSYEVQPVMVTNGNPNAVAFHPWGLNFIQ